MIQTCEAQTMYGLLSPAEGCIEFRLLLLDAQLHELELIARSEQRTIGQLIRRAISVHIAGVCSCGDVDSSEGDFQSDASGVTAVIILLPVSRLANLEKQAARCEITVCELIRRIVCSHLLEDPAYMPKFYEA